MFFNYLLFTLRNLKKQPGFSAIQILSLAIGLVCSTLVIMHVQYIYSYDKHIPNWDNTYRLVTSLHAPPVVNTDITAGPYMEQMALDYPQIELIARIKPASGLFSRDDHPIANAFHWVDPDIIRLFSLDFISGDAQTALQEPNSLIINETVAAKYFPGEDPLGKTLTLDNLTDLNVTGVFRDLPDNTHVDLEMLIPVETGRGIYGQDFMAPGDWTLFEQTRTYLTLPDPSVAREISGDLANFVTRNFPVGQREFAETRQLALYLEPLADIYLSPRRGFGAGNNTHAAAVYFVSIIALLVLITSCINFANLSLSQLQQRSKELGVRKALGARRGQIMTQFLFESVAQTFLALVIAMPIVYFLTPVYTATIGQDIGVNFTPAILLEADNFFGLLAFVLATGILSGLVPAIVLSRHKAAVILKERGAGAGRGRYVRPAVTVVQFMFSSSIIIVTLAAFLQMEFLLNMEMGFDRENLLVLDTGYNPGNPGEFSYDAMKNELQQHPGLIALTTSGISPPNKGAQNTWRLPGSAEEEGRFVRDYLVGEDYIETLGFRLLAGRGFQRDYATDFTSLASNEPLPEPGTQGTHGIVITRDALKNFGFNSPESALDQIFFLNNDPYRVLGVVEDFNFSGGLGPYRPLTNVLRATRDPLRYWLLRIDPARTESALAHIDAVWEKYRSAIPQNRFFADVNYREAVASWRDPIMRITGFASIVTILISACGLYALAFYSTQRRTKEVGVRKVLGATWQAIVALLTWDFVKPVLIASAISCVTGYYAIGWLYTLFIANPPVPVWLYLTVAAGTLAIAVMTVSSQCYRAATVKPVKSLRYE